MYDFKYVCLICSHYTGLCAATVYAQYCLIIIEYVYILHCCYTYV